MWAQDDVFKDILMDIQGNDRKFSQTEYIKNAKDMFWMNISNFKFIINEETLAQIYKDKSCDKDDQILL